jgi:hypothetical protein
LLGCFPRVGGGWCSRLGNLKDNKARHIRTRETMLTAFLFVDDFTPTDFTI